MPEQNIAFFITPHGYGHATRASAVMLGILNRNPETTFHIYTTAPSWLFEETIPGKFIYYPLLTDIGFIQSSPFQEDIDGTIENLENFYPIDQILIRQLASDIRKNNISCVICDIAPIGILAAGQAGIPSILIENFTWSWIYQHYQTEEPRFERYIHLINQATNRAQFHIQTQPVCDHAPSCQLLTNPVSRKPRTPRQITRANLGIPPDNLLILLTIGNLDCFKLVHNDRFPPNYSIIVPGASSHSQPSDQLILLPEHQFYYHPDLIEASDIVIGKVGYSTLAEVFYAQTRFLFIPRKKFPESAPLTQYILENITGAEMSIEELYNGEWQEKVKELITQPAKDHTAITNGADQISDFLIQNHLLLPEN